MAYRLACDQRPTAVVYFSLTGEHLLPDEITQSLHIAPDKSWKKGDEIRPERAKKAGASPRYYTFGRWDLHAPCSRYDEAETQIARLLDRIEPLPVVLNQYIEQFDGAVVVAFASAEDNIGFYLPRTLIRRLSDLQLALVFDIYFASHDE